jgi:plexin A
VYFVTVQRKSHLPGNEEQGYITRIARVCVTDANFDTYTEITLGCGDSDRYNIVQDAFLVEQSSSLTQRIQSVQNDSFLVASFGRSHGSTAIAQNSSSAVCIYSLADIDRHFDENIHKCFNGSMRHRNMEYISGTILEGKCPEKVGSSGNILNFCEVGLKISGRYPVSSPPTYVTSQESVTSVHYSDIQGHSESGVLLLGMNSGNVKTLVVSSNVPSPNQGGVRLLANHALPETTPVTKLVLYKGDYILALQKHTLNKLPVSECSQLYNSCGECVSAADPFCGWCSLENRCTSRQGCRTQEWLTTSAGRDGGQCSRIEQVIPSSLSLPTTATHITVLISALPSLPVSSRIGEGFVCVYGRNVTAVRAKKVARGLQCAIPSPDAFSAYLEHSGTDSIPLDIRFENLGTSLVSTQIQLLDCAKASSCGSCTSQPDCHWCLESNQCVAGSSQGACYQFVRGRVPGQGSSACPRLLIKPDLRVPNDVPMVLKMAFEHLPSYYNSATTFWCLVHIEEAKFKVSARMSWENATVICDETMFNYNAPVAELSARVSVLVNDAGDLLDTQTIKVYKCSVLGAYRGSQDCTLCSARTRSHGCAWCPNVGCTSLSQCSMPVIPAGNGDQCPGPEIFLISPTSGPSEGGTVITLEGSNLGTSLSDLRGRIKIGGQDCVVLALRNSVEATCITPPLGNRGAPNATVTLVTISRRKAAAAANSNSRLQFHYLDYSVSDFSPSKGAASGGALIRIRGTNLNIGTKVKAFFDEVPCQVDRRHRSPTTILCTTGSVGEQRVAQNLTVVIDGALRTTSSPFFYTPDPIVHEIKPLTSFASGGRVLTVHGEYLDSVSSAKFLVYDKQTPTVSECKIFSSRLMECRTPPLREVSTRAENELRSSPVGINFPIGLQMDNVTSLLFLHRLSLTYVKDPTYENFTDYIKVYNGDALVIEGRHLNSASDRTDVRVTIGSDYCNITSLTSTQLLCLPPSHQPPPGDDASGLPEVTVHVGTSLRYQIGYVRYNGADEELISSEVIGAISAITAILVSIGIVILIVLKHKSSQVNTDFFFLLKKSFRKLYLFLGGKRVQAHPNPNGYSGEQCAQ